MKFRFDVDTDDKDVANTSPMFTGRTVTRALNTGRNEEHQKLKKGALDIE